MPLELTASNKSPASSGRLLDGLQTAWPWRNRQPGEAKSAGGRGWAVRQETHRRSPRARINLKRAFEMATKEHKEHEDKNHEGQDDRMRQNKLRAARSAAYRMECPCAPLFARASHPLHPVHPVNSQRPLRLCARLQKYLGSRRELPRATHVRQQLRLVPRQQFICDHQLGRRPAVRGIL